MNVAIFSASGVNQCYPNQLYRVYSQWKKQGFIINSGELVFCIMRREHGSWVDYYFISLNSLRAFCMTHSTVSYYLQEI